MKCPKCGGTLKSKVQLVIDKRRKTPKVQRRLACARCGYVKPTIQGDGWEEEVTGE